MLQIPGSSRQYRVILRRWKRSVKQRGVPGNRALQLYIALLALLATMPREARGESDTKGPFELDAEYRVEAIHINPLELNGHTGGRPFFVQQRLRLDSALKPSEHVRLVVQADLLDGVLFGDNGDYGTDPAPSSGIAVGSKWPNMTRWAVGLVNEEDPLDPDNYGWVLAPADPLKLNHIYGEVLLPIGLLRVGRQPAALGPGISLHDGSRSNRWGVSRYSPTADRILFATKISELFAWMKHGSGYAFDKSMNDGVFLGAVYDLVVEDDPSTGFDDLNQVAGMLQWKVDSPTWGGLDWSPLVLQITVAARFSQEFGTMLWATPSMVDFGVEWFHFHGEFVAVIGHSTEASEGMAALREATEEKRVVYDQKIQGFGAQAIFDGTWGPVTVSLEMDYASGDDDPRDNTPLTTYNFARDMNVGLLLFEHILAFESARSTAVGIENLAHVGARSFPLTEISSEGRFHNGMVLFPQIRYLPVPEFSIRFGTLFAWSAAPVVDPIMTVLQEDGEEISDDAVNWNGGKPARYYGTEFDLQLEWTYEDAFIWTVEGAALIPGNALRDESGDAVPAFLVQNRFTFLF